MNQRKEMKSNIYSIACFKTIKTFDKIEYSCLKKKTRQTSAELVAKAIPGQQFESIARHKKKRTCKVVHTEFPYRSRFIYVSKL